VHTAGPGRQNAARIANQLLREGCDLLLSWGVAGAVAGDLNPGDLVVTTRTFTSAGQLITFDTKMLEQIQTALNLDCQLSTGAIATVTEAASTTAEKAALAERFAAVAVDMESAVIAQVARSASCACVSVRAIVDAADFDVPSAALVGVDDSGRLRPFRTLRALADKPKQLPQMIRLSGHFNSAIGTLKAVASCLTAND
jgi:adenosylhomocysteine nucleosidase